ncbi:MAG TPA: hypothetical protein VH442_09420 [Micromonosporaceae bacterium]
MTRPRWAASGVDVERVSPRVARAVGGHLGTASGAGIERAVVAGGRLPRCAMIRVGFGD